MDNERNFRELLSKKITGSYWGLWLLVAEHLRLGSWDLLKSWSGGSDESLEPRIAMQMVNESALCVSGIRGTQRLCQQGFDVLNGLAYIATDKEIHRVLDSHTIAEGKWLQMALAKLRNQSGHYTGEIFAFDPHRIETSSKRIMPAKKSSPGSRSKKVLQTFFAIDALTGQPIASTIGSPGKKTSRASLELLNMIRAIFTNGGLAMADAEHVTIEILSEFLADEVFDILMPMTRNQKVRKIMPTLNYERKWAGYALAETTYQFKEMNNPIRLIVQRSGEKEEEYEYKPFATTSNDSDMVKMLTEEYPERWTIEEFFNFEAAMGWDKVRTMNLNIRYGKMSLAMIAQAASYQFRKKLQKPYKNWNAKHLAETVFYGIDGYLKVRNDTIIVTLYNVPEELNLRRYYENLPEKLEKEGVDPRVPWMYNFKLDFRFK